MKTTISLNMIQSLADKKRLAEYAKAMDRFRPEADEEIATFEDWKTAAAERSLAKQAAGVSLEIGDVVPSRRDDDPTECHLLEDVLRAVPTGMGLRDASCAAMTSLDAVRATGWFDRYERRCDGWYLTDEAGSHRVNPRDITLGTAVVVSIESIE